MPVAWYRKAVSLPAIWLCLLAPPTWAMELGADTLKAWNEYLQAMQARPMESLKPGPGFLRIDEHPAKRQMLRRGQILVWPVARGGAIGVPSGLIHHWVGTVFIPDATIDQVLAVLRDFDNYKNRYQPSVIGSKLLRREGDDYEFRLRFRRTLLTEAVIIDCTFWDHFVPVGPDRVFSRALSTSTREVKRLGREREHELPEGTGEGYLWRLDADSRFEAADGGVYAELEAIGLSRDIPAVLRVLLDPIIRSLSRSAMEESLRQTRQAVLETLGKKAVDPGSASSSE